MSNKLLDLPEDCSLLKGGRVFGYHSDFEGFATASRHTSLAADSGSSVASADLAAGILVLTTGATDNNEAAVRTTKKVFKFVDNKPLVYETRVQYTEANTDDANVFLGLSSVLGADVMVDNGAGPATSFSGAGFYKVDSAAVNLWGVVVSLGATQTLVVLNAVNSLDKVAKTAGGASYVLFRIEVIPTATNTAEVRFYMDDMLVYKFASWSYASAAVMYAGEYIKAGGANSEVLNVDYEDGWQLR